MKKCLLIVLLAVAGPAMAQNAKRFDPHYKFLKSGNLVADKNFYMLTAVSASPRVSQLLLADTALHAMYAARAAFMQRRINCGNCDIYSLLDSMLYSADDSVRAATELSALYAAHTAAFDSLINGHLRPSGYYALFADSSNRGLLLRAWGLVYNACNGIIGQFGLGRHIPNPLIDSSTYYVNSGFFEDLVREMYSWIGEETRDSFFFSPTLAVAMKLMDISGRDEPARNEPLQDGLNRAACAAIKTTQWKRYPYGAILVPGYGPSLPDVPLSPGGKMRADYAAARYKAHLAPFIIVSGGYVSPFRTKYSEAIEMRNYLIRRYHIPERAIITEPHARHTTTNIRNANRLIYRYGIMADSVLVVSSVSHINSITDTVAFNTRNRNELHYLPYDTQIKRRSQHEAVYHPRQESLFMDPEYPIDP